MNALHGHFTGIGGAVVVGLIAFSACFLVLGGLALIIYGIKYMAKVGERGSGQPSAPAKQQAAQPAQASTAAAVRDTAQNAVGTALAGSMLAGSTLAGSTLAGPAQETIAAITGAVLAARGGKAFSIRTVTQMGTARRSGSGGERRGAWETAGLLENLGELERTWNAPA